MKKPSGKKPSAPAAVPPSLATYAQKRNFTVTPEPPPAPLDPDRGADGPPTFMIHKHDARRLHYDLRLEIDGALASWAVPQGPSFDPAHKRLAVETEDHPLAYAGFEGRIPDGEYGAGEAVVWDRGIYETVPPGRAHAQRDKGHLDLLFLGEKMQGRFHLVRTGGQRQGKRPQWLLMKAKDEHADPHYDPVTHRPESVVSGRRLGRDAPEQRDDEADPITLLTAVWPPPPLLAATVDDRPMPHPRFFARHGGLRAFAALAGGKVALQGENARDLAARYPTVADALAALPFEQAIFEGELCSGAAPRLFLHDVLQIDGNDVRMKPLSQRRELLEGLGLPKTPRVAVTAELPAPLAAALEAAVREKLPAVVARDARAGYTDDAASRIYPTPVTGPRPRNPRSGAAGR